MPSVEFQLAVVAQAARAILEAERPITTDEAFKADYGKKVSRSWQKRVLEKLWRDGIIRERKKDGVSKWEIANRTRLAELAAACPPSVQDEEEDDMAHYSDADKRARCAVAIRALRRLMAAAEDQETSLQQPRSVLFIAKKGDKYQQRQVLDKSWQTPFLDRLVEDGALASRLEQVMVYWVASKRKVQGIIEGTTDPCLHDYLWPDDPCPIDHSKPPAQVADIVEEVAVDKDEAKTRETVTAVTALISQTKKEVSAAIQDLPKEEQKEILLEVAAEMGGSVITTQAPVEPEPEKETEEEKDRDEKVSTEEALEALTDLVTKQSDLIMSLSKAQNMTGDVFKKVLQEVAHVHSKLDKLHEENVVLRQAVTDANDGLTDVIDIVKELEKAFDPNESSINAIRKRLGDLEKLATEHRTSLDSSNKLLKTGLSELASSVVSQAAKAFVQQDHSEVLVKVASVEENLLDSQGRVNKVLGEVYEALEKVRSEYRNNSRMPAILERMESISGELQRLKGLLPSS